MVAVQIHGTHTDLKNIIQQSGMKLNMTDMHPGEPNDETFVKQVTYNIKIPRNNPACNINGKISKTIIDIITALFHFS